MEFVNLETERMYLKNIAIEDAEFMLEHFSNMEINQFLFDAVPYQNLEEALALIRFYEEEKKIDIGYDMQTKFRGCGYMQEALAAILIFAKEQLPVSRIEAHIYVDNLKSIALATKLGFSFEGQTEMCQFMGKDYLHYIYIKNIT